MTGPRLRPATPLEIAARERKINEPPIQCPNACGRSVKIHRVTYHLRTCGRECVILNCSGEQVARGLCGNHKTMFGTAKKYGLTLEEYTALHEAQRGRCAACKTIPKRALCLDHDHVTGKRRGLLCHNCNVSLGLLKDDPVRLRELALYLERYMP